MAVVCTWLYNNTGSVLQVMIFSISTGDMGAIVCAAWLAHDIGNPSFGHSGENAIKEFDGSEGKEILKGLSEEQKKDFTQFDGNVMRFFWKRFLRNKVKGG